MKLTVEDGGEVAIFTLFDSDVECLAMETCPVLYSLVFYCIIFLLACPDCWRIILNISPHCY
jgi:hypothetical protein